jgi:hypothetical protein
MASIKPDFGSNKIDLLEDLSFPFFYFKDDIDFEIWWLVMVEIPQ